MDKKKALMLTGIVIGTLCILMFVMAGISALMGGNNTPPAETTSESVSEPEEINDGSGNTANNKGAPAPAIQFVNALCNEDYQTILGMLDLPDNSVVTPVNIQHFMERSTLKDFLGADYIKIVKHQTSSNESAVAARIALKGDEEAQQNTIDVGFSKNKEGAYVLGMQSAYAERYLIAPGGATIRIGGKTLNPEDAKPYLNDKEVDEGTVVYTLICPRDNFDVYVSTQFTDYTVTVEFNDETTPYSVINYDTPEGIVETTTTKGIETMNQILTKIQAKEPITDFLSENVDPKLEGKLNDWYNNHAGGITNISLTAFMPSDRETDISYISGNKTIHVYAKYTSSFTQMEKTQTHNGYMECIFELDHGTYKLVWTNLPEDYLFFNSMDQQW